MLPRVRVWIVGAVLVVAAVFATANPAVERLPDGIRLRTDTGYLHLQIESDSIVRVLFSRTRHPRVDRLVVVGPGNSATPAALNPFRGDAITPVGEIPPRWTMTTTDASVTLATDRLQVTVTLADGAVTFADAEGRTILAEVPGAHRITPAAIQGQDTNHVRQQWIARAGESLYGLGQRQEGRLDLSGYDLDLWQRNTVVDIPFLVSSRGYGVLWDNTSFTRFGDLRRFVPIPPDRLVDLDGRSGALTHGTEAPGGPLEHSTRVATIELPARRAPRSTQVWTGSIVPLETGDYQIRTYSNGGITLWLDGRRQIDHWKQNWATEYDQVKVHFEKGRRYRIRIASSGADTLRVAWKTPPPTSTPAPTSLWSESGDAIDYYFVYGPELDRVVAGYRALTGRASILPRWAFGLWQSKNAYNTQADVVGTLAEFRRRRIPLDVIVQDWHYWRDGTWGSHIFDPARYPDPDAMIRAIHDRGAHFMISVWGKFYPGTANFQSLQQIGGLYLPPLANRTRDWLGHVYTFYDAFNASARKMFWDQIDRALFRKGIDAWWMDATEPDLVQPSPPTRDALTRAIGTTAIGPAAQVMAAYPLMNSEAVYDGQRSVAPRQRVLILTRSAFAGVQRYGTVTWSGDVTSEWTTLRKQIAAGLGFSISGDPYWTSDTGGYTMRPRFAAARGGQALDEWRELNARWFEFSTFCPILRVHGADRPREMWNLGGEASPVYRAELRFDRLRYAMLPYIYSAAGAVSLDGYTLMRPLVMDFPSDVAARDIADEYLFGPAFLVSPVTTYHARTRRVYLPRGGTWYDFWTGQRYAGGQTITANAPYDRIPLHIRSGSIVPFGADEQFVGQKQARTVTLYVYAGANGRFSLYEDDGLTYGYETGAFSRIPLEWDDSRRTLTIGSRMGSFDGMPLERTFDVVLISPERPEGYSPAAQPLASVRYDGARVDVRF